ncbi:MAG: hypothetical protein ACERKD_23735 [Prolixibacteraceae bacterium]
MNKLSVLTIGCIFLINVSFAQSFESMMQKGNSMLQDLDQSSADKMNALTAEFIDFVEKNDKEFAARLKREWKPFQPQLAIEAPVFPGPDEIPVYQSNTNVPLSPLVPKMAAVPPMKMDSEGVRPLKRKVINDQPSVKSSSFPFFNTVVKISYDANLVANQFDDVNPKSLAQVWDKLSNVDYVSITEQLNQYKNLLGLNDWGYYELCEAFAKSIKPDKNYLLIQWYLLVRSGYDFRLGYSNGEFVPLLPSLQRLYAKSFITINGISYYVMDRETQEINTLDEGYPGANRIFDFSISQSLNFPEQLSTRTLTFNFDNRTYNLDIVYDKSWVDYYAKYPLTELHVYFDAPVSEAFKTSLSTQVKPILESLGADQSIEFLLSLTQQAFNYQTDRQQFGKEKFFFAEESLSFPYCDCEDRSIFFSYIIDLLVGKEVIAVEYPGHVATAIETFDNARGRTFKYDSKTFVIADPTFVGAPIGAEMPQFSNSNVQIIPLMNRSAYANLKQKLWSVAQQMGGFRAGGDTDFVLDGDKAYLTGYFVDEAFTSKNKLASVSGNRSNFIACMNTSGQVEWSKSLRTSGPSAGLNLKLSDNAVYWSGSYSGSIASSGSFENKPNDLFLACLSKSDGSEKWMKPLGIDVSKERQNLTYLVQASLGGTDVSVDYFNDDNAVNDYSFWVADDHVYLTGATNKTIGLQSINELTTTTNFSMAEDLKKVSDELINQKYDRYIASLFAVMQIMGSNGSMIKGSHVKETIDKYNPGFKNRCPNIYSSITKINFLKNSQGVVTILTDDGKSFTIEKIKLENNSKIQLITLENGNGMWKVLNGIKVGKAIIWFDLNFVELFHESGDLLFDYDDDHTKVTMNLYKDILL